MRCALIPHGDHVGGLAPSLRTLSVREIVNSGQRYSGHAYLDAVREAAIRRVPVVVALTRQVMRFSDGVSGTFLAPYDSWQRYGGHAYLNCLHEAAVHRTPVVVAPDAPRRQH